MPKYDIVICKKIAHFWFLCQCLQSARLCLPPCMPEYSKHCETSPTCLLVLCHKMQGAGSPNGSSLSGGWLQCVTRGDCSDCCHTSAHCTGALGTTSHCSWGHSSSNVTHQDPSQYSLHQMQSKSRYNIISSYCL